MAKQTVQFGRTAFEAMVAELAEIVARVKSVRGSVSVRKTLATWEALGQDFDWKDCPTVKPGETTIGDLSLWVESVNAWAEQVADEAVTGILKQASPDADELAALKETYTTKRDMVNAMRMLLEAQQIDVSDIEIPALKVSTSTSGTTRTVKTSGMHFYRIIDDEKKDQPDSQDKLSSFAHYFGHKILKTGGSIGSVKVAELTTGLEKNFKIENFTKPWEIEVDGVKYGMEILDK